MVEVGLSTLSGGVDKTLFCVDEFVHRRLEFPGKSRFLPQMRPRALTVLGFFAERLKGHLSTQFFEVANASVDIKTLYPSSSQLWIWKTRKTMSPF